MASSKKPVSKKRSDAARANGAKSKGPKTLEGKLISSMNAVTHGLLSARIAPSRESSYYPLFRRIHKILLEAFGPSNGLDVMEIDALAAEYMHLVRAYEMSERLVNGNPTEDEVGAAKRYRMAQKPPRLLRAAMRSLDGEFATSLSTSRAAAAASLIAKKAEVIETSAEAVRLLRIGLAAYEAHQRDAADAPDSKTDEGGDDRPQKAVQVDDSAADDAAVEAVEAELRLMGRDVKTFDHEDYSEYASVDREIHDEVLELRTAAGSEITSLRDGGHVYSVLCRETKLTPRKRRQWEWFLSKFIAIAQRDADVSAVFDREKQRSLTENPSDLIRRKERDRLAGIIGNLDDFERLALLRRYITSIKGSIEHSIRGLIRKSKLGKDEDLNLWPPAVMARIQSRD